MSFTVSGCVNASLTFAAAGDQATQSYVEQVVEIRNGRLDTGGRSLDRDGFSLFQHSSVVSNFYAADEVTHVYYPEIVHLITEVTGAAVVRAFTHSVRCAAKAHNGDPVIQQPFKLVHNDYTAKTGPLRVRGALGAQATELMRHPFSVFNIWRPIHGPLEESPLAICNCQSVAERDVIPILSKDPAGNQIIVYSLAFNSAQRWSYFPRMHSNEVLIFKTFDSRQETPARFTFHSAFDDPNTPANAKPRESIEVRAVAFFA
jgi:hypothetical protein